ncbi:MAG TPA: hypothetical protein O0X39_01900 [Methanocorpusculum sp.]|nr:hypothetical protein [Methanocorpusculum sp.]
MRHVVCKIVLVLIAVLAVVSMIGCVSAEVPTDVTITANSGTHYVDDTITFTISATGATKYKINYGEGGGEEDVTPPTAKHNYTNEGEFTVTLTAISDTDEKETKDCKVTVSKKSSKPTDLSIKPSPNLPKVDEEVTFTISATGATKYKINYGEGGGEEDVTPSTAKHKYTKEGEFTVTLTAISDTDEKETKTCSITVSAPKVGDITAITITGLDAPEKGKQPDNSCSISSTPQKLLTDDNYSVTWKSDTGECKTEFAAATQYTADIETIYATDGKTFASDISIEGLPSTAKITNKSLGLNNDRLTVSITYPATEANDKVIKTLTLKGVTAPIRGAAADAPKVPTASVSTDQGDAVEVPTDFAWYTGNSKITETTFKENTEYTLKFKINAKDNFCFNSSTKAFATGSSDQKVTSSTDGKSVDVAITYPATGFTIESLTISGIQPVEGKYPSEINKATVTTSPANGAASSAVSWDSSSKFTSGKSYEATIVITAKDNVEFKSPKPTVKVDSTTVPEKDITLNPDKKTLTVKYTYDKVSSSSSDTIKLTLSQVPEADKTAPSTASIDSSTTGVEKAEVTWSPKDSTFKSGSSYTATITLTPKDGYSLDTSKKVLLNDEEIPSSGKTMDGNKLVITKKYSGMYLSSVALTVAKPEEGNTPTKYAEVSSPSSGVKIDGDVTWNPSTAKFETDFNYFATIPVKASDGYFFNNDTKFTINGADATIQSLSSDNTKAEVKSASMSLAGISEVQFTLSGPQPGGTPGTLNIINPSSGVTSKVTWSPELSGSKFAQNTVYTATIVFTTTDKFISDAKAVWNGEKHDATITSDKKTMTITHQFASTGAIATATKTATPKPTSSEAKRPNIETETEEPTDEDGEEDELFFPNPLNMMSEFLELFYALFDPATYGIEIEDDDGGAQDKDKDKGK